MRVFRFVPLCGFLLAIAGCSGSSNESADIDEKCEQACQAIQAEHTAVHEPPCEKDPF